MLIKAAQFVTSAVTPSQYPEADFPEIAFAGRSNVGKSSLINRLLNRKKLVKTSSTPGKTRLINFFLVNGSFYFVDLPGFGYAKVSAAERKKWRPMVETYLNTRPTLQAVVLLLDIRRTPGEMEHDLIAFLSKKGIPVLPVLTKCDKFSKSRQAVQAKAICAALSIAKEIAILFSAKTGQGRDLLWERIEYLIQEFI
ncbi:MAG: YihA family ribosome biogenesis GTP-binding protein [Deltaproteobacteria bacterium]|nr:YihA family ribosome biogenesis GTP-binding protein [Deltaproteobacteria bacterium]